MKRFLIPISSERHGDMHARLSFRKASALMSMIPLSYFVVFIEFLQSSSSLSSVDKFKTFQNVTFVIGSQQDFIMLPLCT